MKGILQYLSEIDETKAVVRTNDPIENEAAEETVFTLSNGYLGVRGSVAFDCANKENGTFIAGLFDKEEKGEANEVCGLTLKNKAITPAYAIVPDSNLMRIEADGLPFDLLNCECLSAQKTLDMQRGIVVFCHTLKNADGKVITVRVMNVVSKTRKHDVLYKAEIVAENFDGAVSVAFCNVLCQNPQYIPRLKDYISCTRLNDVSQKDGEVRLLAKVAETGDEIVLLSRTIGDGEKKTLYSENGVDEWFRIDAKRGQTYSFVKRAAYFSSHDNDVREISPVDEETLLAEHFAFWRDAWEKADVEICGDDELQQGLRWNIFNLIQLENVGDSDVSISATGLHGQGYFGHAFWDTEIFMLPFYLATEPKEAKTLLKYRYDRLNEARNLAQQCGCQGAKFPWTSAYTGADVTPPDWERCANRQIHISGDIAYAFYNYYVHTGDRAFFDACGVEVIVETAKFYASKAVKGADGKYHLFDVIGPDEYNIHADDNYFTNHLVKWNVATAVSAMAELKARDEERYAAVAQKTGYDEDMAKRLSSVAENFAFPQTREGVCEQYNGFFSLKDDGPIERDESGMPKDKKYVYASGSQVLKQADVVMMHYLFPDDFSAEVQKASFDYYEKRCNHGSSLSPSIHCVVGLRNGFKDHAYSFLRLTALLDLKNMHLDKNLHEGIHMACAGGTWSAAVYGFGGMRIKNGELHFDPILPDKLSKLKYACAFCGVSYRVEVEKGAFSVVADRDSHYYVGGKQVVCAANERKRFEV